MKHIVLTGGGTAGHVTPNIALIPKLKEAGYKISYIGSYEADRRSRHSVLRNFIRKAAPLLRSEKLFRSVPRRKRLL